MKHKYSSVHSPPLPLSNLVWFLELKWWNRRESLFQLKIMKQIEWYLPVNWIKDSIFWPRFFETADLKKISARSEQSALCDISSKSFLLQKVLSSLWIFACWKGFAKKEYSRKLKLSLMESRRNGKEFTIFYVRDVMTQNSFKYKGTLARVSDSFVQSIHIHNLYDRSTDSKIQVHFLLTLLLYFPVKTNNK